MFNNAVLKLRRLFQIDALNDWTLCHEQSSILQCVTLCYTVFRKGLLLTLALTAQYTVLLHGEENLSVLIGSLLVRFCHTDRFCENSHKHCIFCFRKPANSKQAWLECHIINYLLTEQA